MSTQRYGSSSRPVGRTAKQQIAQETLSICESGSYSSSIEGRSAVDVSISPQLAQALASTVLYRPNDALPTYPQASIRQYVTRVSVRNEDTLLGARHLVERHKMLYTGDNNGPAVLNFASAKHPGGGFLSGATAQEESLARCSALYKCQIKYQREFYDHHNRASDEASRLCLYSSSIIYSPGVPVFRSSDHSLLSQPFQVSFLTCPAVNMSNAARVGVSWQQGRQGMLERASRVLHVIRAHGHRHVVLGAWGCGVFRNPPEDVAGIFSALLGPGGEFEGVFEEIVFSVLDNTKTLATFRAFEVLDSTAQ